MVALYDLVKGPQTPTEPDPYNVKWEDEARAAAAADNPVAAVTRTAAIDETGGAVEDMFTITAHGLTTNQPIRFTEITTTTGINTSTTYYVIVNDANTFQVSLTPGGAVVAVTGDGSAEVVLDLNALVGTPITPAHYFDSRDGSVTADPVLYT